MPASPVSASFPLRSLKLAIGARLALTLCMAVSAVAAVSAVPADAAEAIHGYVLSLDKAKHEAVVRHDAFGGMPGMTMPFRVPRERDFAALHPGDEIRATVNRATEPWTLEFVTSAPGVALTEPSSVLRSVHHLVPGDEVPATRFVDQRGRAFTFAGFRGQDVVLSFIYTRCRDARMCPLVSSNFHSLQNLIARGPYHLVEITLDPAFDRPNVLAAYASRFDANPARWTLGTGRLDDVLDFAAGFGISPFPDPSIGLIHAERTAIIDRDGTIRYLIDEPAWNPNDMYAQLRATDHLSSNVLARFNLWLQKQAVAMCGNNVAAISGYGDLVVAFGMLAAFAWVLYRIASRVFAKNA